MEAGSRQENASNQEPTAPLRFHRNGNGPRPNSGSRTVVDHQTGIVAEMFGESKVAPDVSSGRQARPAVPLDEQVEDRLGPRYAGGINPRRLAMILSSIRLGRIAVIRCRIGSGVIW